jgi:GNAT superfamily N-acetyltransferase
MNKKLEIQLCSEDDADAISAVAIRSYMDYYLHLWNDDGSWYINRSFLPHVIRKEMHDHNARFYLLKIENENIGFMKLNLEKPLPELGCLNAMELERIYLLKTFAARGFGRQAIQFCKQLAQKMNREMLWLKSMDSSPAIDFYQRLGFTVCGSSTLDYEIMKPEFRGMKTLAMKLQ